MQQDAPEAIECRHKPLGPYHEVSVPLENRIALGQLTQERGHVDRKKGAITRLGPQPRIFVANLDELSLWSDRSTLHDTTVVGEGSLKLHTSFSAQFGWEAS